MPNGTVEDRFNSFFFLGKEFWFGVLGTSQGGSHPQVGARCYLLNKSIFNKSTQIIYILIVMKISGHIMKDFWVTNKVGISGALFFKKFESFNFWWLRRNFQQFISHQKAQLLAANSFDLGPH